DRRPALIVRCRTACDVVAALALADRTGLEVSIRGGGHNVAGRAVADDGLMIDLAELRAVTVDPVRATVTAGGGTTWAELNAAAAEHGLAVTGGAVSSTGVAGLTLGGGLGWLMARYGLAADNLQEVELVTAAGAVLRVDAGSHPDLFWALRGGGGNFGVVTRFEFRLHPVGPELLTGLIVFPIASAKSVLRQYREFMITAPDELAVWVVLRKAPPLPFLPPSVHGQGVVILAMVYAGDPKPGQASIEPLRKFGPALGEHIGVQPYVAWQQAFDPLLTPGARNYWKSHNFTELKDELLDKVIEYVGKLPSPECEIFFGAIGAATTRMAPDATAYAHRDARYVMNVHGRWRDAADDQHCIAWARDYFKASAPFASGGVYVNFLTAEEGDRVRAAYGPSFDRLARIKRKYDPDNLFRTNWNIKPS
ncbi:MAG TPA: FAD-binding oxidoreductase, partial [Casimicrobiaceae bacterium]|nr:FAD-binding oxidoreductase [Casimicrobiaceae bacterium]